MTEAELKRPPVLPRGKPSGFCFQENELYRVFQPLIGSTAVALYCNLSLCVFGYDARFTFSRSSLATLSRMSRATVARELSVLAHLGMVTIRACGGNLQSEGELSNLRQLAESMGAVPGKRTRWLALPPETAKNLKAEVIELRRRLQGKEKKVATGPTQVGSPAQLQVEVSSSASMPDSKRDASVSPEGHQPHTRETQAEVQQIKENRRQENALSLTPFRSGDLWKSKDVSDENKAASSLKCARDLFCGAMNELKHHLVDPSRPHLAHLGDGYEDWQRFGFESLGAVKATQAHDSIRLLLCASDPAVAKTGLTKYCRTWAAIALRWFGCTVTIEWQSTPDREGGGVGQISRASDF